MPHLPGWNSLEAVTRYHRWAEITGIGLLALLVITALISHRYGQRKDNLAAQQQAAAAQQQAAIDKGHDEEMTRLHRQTAELTADAEESRALIAAAASRQAEAEAKTKEAEVQLLQLRFPRTLNIGKFREEVADIPVGSFEILYDLSSADSSGLAFQFFVALNQAGWKTTQKLPAPLAPRTGPKELSDAFSLLPLPQQAGGAPWGVSVVTNADPDLNQQSPAEQLVRVLMQSIVGSPSQTSLGRDATMPDGMIRIVVGPKLL